MFSDQTFAYNPYLLDLDFAQNGGNILCVKKTDEGRLRIFKHRY